MRFDATLVDSGFQSQREQPLHGDFDKRLARAALELGVLDAASLMDLTAQLARSERPRSLGALMLEAGLVSRDRLHELERSADRIDHIDTWAHDAQSASEPRDALPATPAPMPVGDRYTTLREIGRGGAGVVIAVQDRVVGRSVALKRLQNRDLGGIALARFMNEARIQARLQHPGVVPVYDLVTLEDGTPGFTMRWVEGVSLTRVIHAPDGGGPDDNLDARRFRLMQILSRLCEVVSYAHAQGVIHRDLKPDNVLVGAFGEVLLMDWGIAKVRGDEDAGGEGAGETAAVEAGAALLSDLSFNTQAGAVVGTPGYMAPEQVGGAAQAMDERTDVFALGAIMYEMLTRTRPFEGKTPLSVLMATLAGQPAPPRTRAPELRVPAVLEATCLRALAHAPHDRFQGVAALRVELERFLTGSAERERQQVEYARRVQEAQTIDDLRSMLRDRVVEARQGLQGVAPLSPHAPLEDKRARWTEEDTLRSLNVRLNEANADLKAKLMQALEVMPEATQTRRALAELYWQDYREAQGDARFDDAARHLEQAYRFADASFARRLAPRAPVSITTVPSGAEVWCSAWVEGDRVLRPGPPSVLGRTPLRDAPVPTGRVLLELRVPGRPAVKLPLHLWPGDEVDLHIALPGRDDIDDEFVFVPGGQYVRGNDPRATLAAETARVHVQPFLIGRYPVTCAAYAEFLNALPLEEAERRAPRQDAVYWRPDATGAWPLPQTDPDGTVWAPEWPVCGVSRHDAEAYCAWRSELEGVVYRLPTEDEWEKAARGPDGRLFPWGDHLDLSFCNVRGSHPADPSPLPVGTFTVDESPYGVRDLAGGVRDWVSGALPMGDRLEPIVRGGAWNLPGAFAHAAGRWTVPAHRAVLSNGFRLVRAFRAT